jgi:hypothetical protein
MQYIMFGWFFALLVALGTNLWFEKRKLFPWIIPWLTLPLGIMSSIASGPMTMAVLAMLICACFPWRQLWKPVVWAGAALLAAAKMYSNRGFFELISQFGFDPISSWYRFRLVRRTLDEGGMKDHWLLGYGLIPSPLYDDVHDLCVQWVMLMVKYGLLGVAGFYWLVGAVGWGLWKTRKKSTALADQWMLWSMMATVVASLAAMQVVSLFGETEYIFYMLLGVMANAPLLLDAAGGGERVVGVLTEVEGRQVLLRYRLKPGQQLALVQPAEPEEKTTLPARRT